MLLDFILLIASFRYLGDQDTGLLLAEASDGNLQEYIDEHSGCIALSLCKKWFRQAAEAVAFLHSKGVIHSDLCPENFLVNASSDPAASPDILLCDFGGSMCKDLNRWGHLPDPGFFDPTQKDLSTPATDIFSLGSIFYAVLTGHWPYRLPDPFMTLEERDENG